MLVVYTTVEVSAAWLTLLRLSMSRLYRCIFAGCPMEQHNGYPCMIGVNTNDALLRSGALCFTNNPCSLNPPPWQNATIFSLPIQIHLVFRLTTHLWDDYSGSPTENILV